MKSVPKTLIGIALIVGGSACSLVPALAAASPWIIKLGYITASAGLIAKAVRAASEKSFKNIAIHEKNLFGREKNV